MRFWDSSAIVPLVCREAESGRCRALLRVDPILVVWSLAATEVISALSRKRREGRLSAARFDSAKQRLLGLEGAWSEVSPLDAVRLRARRLLEVHPLAAADALHLAASLVLVEERTRGAGFVSLDERLREAAGREGFAVLP